MKVQIKPGTHFETLTPREAQAMLDARAEQDSIERVRATQVIVLDAAGSGQDEVYTVPMGFEFGARRVTLDLDTCTDGFTGAVALGVAGIFVLYQRSGAKIEYAYPLNPAGGAAKIPGVQTWGDQQGPYLRNGEVFQVRAVGLTPNARLICVLEGIQYKRPRSRT